MCSYVSPDSLLPPHELISAGAIARDRHNAEVQLIDAIASNGSVEDTIEKIKSFETDIILTITGFECYEEDVELIQQLKQQLSHITFIIFGHYPTLYPEISLKTSGADYLILGEPDLVFYDLLKAIASNNEIEHVNGICYLKEGVLVQQGHSVRITQTNELPLPAYDLLPQNAYFEPLMKRPYGMIQTARGCPYQCNYCVRTFGTKLTTLDPERIIEEMKLWKKIYKVKSIRFIDDTFTINKKRVIALCKLIIENQLDIEWACLSRTDNLDEEVLGWMKAAGCQRIYFGLETGSQRMLDLYLKKVNKEEAIEALLLCKKTGIETAGFFMSGHPEENEEDFLETIDFAKKAKLSYASFNPLTPYPGTAIFKELENEIEFSIYPYKNTWKSEKIYEDFDRRKKLFYKAFYMRPSYATQNFSTILSNLPSLIDKATGLIRYVWWDKKFIISGLKGKGDK
jgi:anaerobic magnesium-protoporphyrin IX monomethyl ester cyclase